jgi:hypothetical protein
MHSFFYRKIIFVASSIAFIHFSFYIVETKKNQMKKTIIAAHIWYPMFDIRAYLIDAVVSWGLVGIWLGWWMNRRTK